MTSLHGPVLTREGAGVDDVKGNLSHQERVQASESDFGGLALSRKAIWSATSSTCSTSSDMAMPA